MEMKVYFPGGKRVYADYGNFTIETDQPARGGGDDSAPAPFDLFLASIGTCAGIFALGFMQQRGIDPEGSSISMSPQFDPNVGLITKIDLEMKLPAGFPEKYKAAIVNAMNLCTVKKHLHQPPEFEIDDHGRLMADHFDPMHAPSLEDPARLEALPQSAVVELLRLEGAETVVDYGAGTGIYTVAVAAAVPDGKVFAVEALPQLANCCARRSRRSCADRICVCETGDNVVPLDDGEADRVVMVDVLHHLYDQPEALEEVGRVLRPGGLFVVARLGRHGAPGRPAARPCARPGRRCARSSPGWASTWSRPTSTGELLPYHLVVVAAKP